MLELEEAPQTPLASGEAPRGAASGRDATTWGGEHVQRRLVAGGSMPTLGGFLVERCHQ